MSRANVEIVRRVHDAWARGDYTPVDVYDPEIEFETREEGVAHHVYHGLTEMARAWGDILSVYDHHRTDTEEIIDASDKVVVFVVSVVRLKGSEAELAQKSAVVWTLRGGKAVRLALYSEREKALREAGINH